MVVFAYNLCVDVPHEDNNFSSFVQFHLCNKSFEKPLRVLAKTMLSDFEEKYYMPPEF